jgi:hypothetical protein
LKIIDVQKYLNVRGIYFWYFTNGLLRAMKRKLLYFVLMATLSMGTYSFPLQNDPPEPETDKSHDNGVGPCGQPDQGQGTPPPPGLCLPINDYLLPLLVSGILLGAYNVRKVTKT